ncbi:MAG: response regulator [Melioribacteraceae bacterium]|nr:response regulator [Melioribacteraceae bacterium]MCF8393338.1 response regulator [Melioribacteraceae bacterium]MCF8418903.1 response regulator [Melioribacteraceae bacterium]
MKNSFDREKLKHLTKDEESLNEILNIIQESLSENYSKEELIFFEEINNFFVRTSDYSWSITYSNDSAQNFISGTIEKLTGYKAKDLEKKPGQLLFIVHEDDKGEVKRIYTEAENRGKKNIFKVIYRIINKDERTLWIRENICVKRDDDGNAEEIFRLLCNISDIKEVESELRESLEKLQELNSTKDKFISIVSHDLRAPFTSLLGFSEILLNEEDLSREERREYLNYIYDASKTQLALVNHLLDWSRLQSGRLQIDTQRIKLRTMVSNCVSSLTGAAIRKSIDIKTEISKDLHVNVDDRLMQQVITNLISNAIKFTPEKKSVHITANQFKQGMVELIITDQGVGIPEADQSKLFRIDEKHSTAGTKGEKGSGLGLMLVKEIVEKHGGQIWFYSKEGEGSEFHITMPEAKNIIMLVEDDKIVRSLYLKIINMAVPTYEIVQASNGYEAMTMLMQKSPSLLITDHEMPLMNGIQLLEAIRKRESNKNIPVIVISAEFTKEIKNKYKALGVDYMLPKPFENEDLIEQIQKSMN